MRNYKKFFFSFLNEVFEKNTEGKKIDIDREHMMEGGDLDLLVSDSGDEQYSGQDDEMVSVAGAELVSFPGTPVKNNVMRGDSRDDLRRTWRHHNQYFAECEVAKWKEDVAAKSEAGLFDGRLKDGQAACNEYAEAWMAPELLHVHVQDVYHALALQLANVNKTVSGQNNYYRQYDAAFQVSYYSDGYLLVTCLSYAMMQIFHEPLELGEQHNWDATGRQTWINLHVLDYQITSPILHSMLLSDGVSKVWVILNPQNGLWEDYIFSFFAHNTDSTLMWHETMDRFTYTFRKHIIGNRVTVEVGQHKTQGNGEPAVIVAENIYLGHNGNIIDGEGWETQVEEELIKHVANETFGDWRPRYSYTPYSYTTSDAYGYWPAPCYTFGKKMLWNVGRKKVTEIQIKEADDKRYIERYPEKNYGAFQFEKHENADVIWTLSPNSWSDLCCDTFSHLGLKEKTHILKLCDVVFVQDLGFLLQMEDGIKKEYILLPLQWYEERVENFVLLNKQIDQKLKVYEQKHGKPLMEFEKIFDEERGRALLLQVAGQVTEIDINFARVGDCGPFTCKQSFFKIDQLQFASQTTIFIPDIKHTNTLTFDTENFLSQNIEVMFHRHLRACMLKAEAISSQFTLQLMLRWSTARLLTVANPARLTLVDGICKHTYEDPIFDNIVGFISSVRTYAMLAQTCKTFYGNYSADRAYEMVFQQHLNMLDEAPRLSVNLAKGLKTTLCGHKSIELIFSVDGIMSIKHWIRTMNTQHCVNSKRNLELEFGNMDSENEVVTHRVPSSAGNSDVVDSDVVDTYEGIGTWNVQEQESVVVNNLSQDIDVEDLLTESDSDTETESYEGQSQKYIDKRSHILSCRKLNKLVSSKLYEEFNNSPVKQKAASSILKCWPLLPGTLDVMCKSLIPDINSKIESVFASAAAPFMKNFSPFAINLKPGRGVMSKIDHVDSDFIYSLLDGNSQIIEPNRNGFIDNETTSTHVWTANLKIEKVMRGQTVLFLRKEFDFLGANTDGWHQVFAGSEEEINADEPYDDTSFTLIASDGYQYVPIITDFDTLMPILQHLACVYNLKVQSVANTKTESSYRPSIYSECLLEGAVVQVDVHMINPIVIRTDASSEHSAKIFALSEDARHFPPFPSNNSSTGSYINQSSIVSLTGFVLPSTDHIRLVYSGIPKSHFLPDWPLMVNPGETPYERDNNIAMAALAASAPRKCVLNPGFRDNQGPKYDV